MRYFRMVIPMLPVTAMAIFPFVIVDRRDRAADQVLLQHEMIHLRQQVELLVLPFYLLYGYYYLKGRIKGLPAKAAYRAIPFEVESYRHEAVPGYLRHRSRFAWMKYRK